MPWTLCGQPLGRPEVPEVNMMEWMRAGLSFLAADIRLLVSMADMVVLLRSSATGVQPGAEPLRDIPRGCERWGSCLRAVSTAILPATSGTTTMDGDTESTMSRSSSWADISSSAGSRETNVSRMRMQVQRRRAYSPPLGMSIKRVEPGCTSRANMLFASILAVSWICVYVHARHFGYSCDRSECSS